MLDERKVPELGRISSLPGAIQYFHYLMHDGIELSSQEKVGDARQTGL